MTEGHCPQCGAKGPCHQWCILRTKQVMVTVSPLLNDEKQDTYEGYPLNLDRLKVRYTRSQ